MPRNGAGVYSLPALNPVAGGTIIASAWANNTMNDLAAAMTQSIAANGVTAISANLPMSGFKHTGVANAAAFDQYDRASQVQEFSHSVVTSVGGGPANYTGLLDFGQPALRPFVAGQMIIFKPNIDSVGVPTLNINGGGAIAIVNPDGVAPAVPLKAASSYLLVYTASKWQISYPVTATVVVPTDFPVGPLFANGNSTAVFNYNPTNGRLQSVVLSTASPAIVLGSPTASQTGWWYLEIYQDATGGRQFNNPFALAKTFGGNLLDAMPSPANSGFMLGLFWDGTQWYGTSLGVIGRTTNYVTTASRVTSNQATVAGVLTKVQWNTASGDTYSEWDTTTNFRWSGKSSGIYQIETTIQCQNASAAAVHAELQVVGAFLTSVDKRMAAAATTESLTFSYTLLWNSASVAAASYLEWYFSSTTGAGSIMNLLGCQVRIIRIGDYRG